MSNVDWIAAGLTAVFGLLIGSFLNVCIYRIPRDLSVVFPRSFCPECGTSIAWYHNIPVLSFILLRGRCRSCHAKFGVRYLLVEITTPVVLAATEIKYGLTLTAGKWGLFELLLIVLFWTDLEERLLPDEFTFGGTGAGLLLSLFVAVPGLIGDLVLPSTNPRVSSLLNSVAGAVLISGVLWIVGSLFSFLLKREALGLGDVKLLMMIGSFLGLESSIFAMVISTLLGAAIGAGYILLARRDPRSYALPFGTFCCFGAALMPFLAPGLNLTGAVR